MRGRIRSWFKVRFITGFFVTVPVVLTAWVLWVFYAFVDDFMAPMYGQFLGRQVPGLGFLTALVILFVIGLFATNVVGRRVVQWGETVLLRVPLVRRVYPTVKDFVEAFSPHRRTSFREFVLVEHPRPGAFAYGFLTGEIAVGGLGPEALVSVYVPTNHLYLGDVVLVSRASIRSTGLSIEDGIRIVLSAGTGAPSRLPVPGVVPGGGR